LQITQEQIKTEKIKYEKLHAKGFDERKIKIIIIQLDKDRHIKKFLLLRGLLVSFYFLYFSFIYVFCYIYILY
ncbi:hypothetical protein K9K83_06435, partial [Candidatus Woesearchaeota archaeon]|nr:hypothetical protein [Candidatus Woesearchaeota archaeon]